MNPLPISQIAKFAEANLESGDGAIFVERVSTDSRSIKTGELFVALRGENFDGHKFVEDVAKTGAAGAMVDEEWWSAFSERADRLRRSRSTFAFIRAKDTLLAYQNLAANYRKSLPSKVLAITGSNGKTSTKDFSASVFGRKFRVTKTQGNFNNHVGLPRTILDAGSNDQVAVWEIGMNHPGEVAPFEQVPGGFDFQLECPGVVRGYLSHHDAQRRLSHLNQEMQMVGHPAVRVNACVVLLQGTRNDCIEQVPITVGQEYRLPMVASQSGVIEGVVQVDASGARHG